MPHQVIYEGRGSYTRYFGAVTSAEIVERVQRGQALPHFDHRRYAIHDFLGIDSLIVVARDVEELAARDSGARLSNARLQVAVVGTRPEVQELVQAYSRLPLATFPIRLFSALEDARDSAERLPVSG